MTKVGIIRCQEQSNACAGWNCLPAVRDRSGAFDVYSSVELVGFDTCGGCGRNKADKIVSRVQRLREKGAEVIHLGNCMVGVCPWKEMYLAAIKEQVQIPVVDGTHGSH
ncbi:MAG: CGGC domain-containing protein [Chloroflexi bacterium]|nr:CGGC domain-containing protein [Chloroflexota bacterium]